MAIYNPDSNQHSDGTDTEVFLDTKDITVLTAEGYLRQIEVYEISIGGIVYEMVKLSQAVKMAKKFAELHCIEQAEVISENVEADFEPMGWLAEHHLNDPFIAGEDYEIPVSRQSILNAYPLNLIK
jgi:hypothetical protein